MAKKTAKKRKHRGGGAKGVENTKAKQQFIADLIHSQPAITMSAAGKKVTEKFGTMIGFNALRAAFLAGGGKLTNRGRKRNGAKPASSASRTSANVPRGIGRRSSDSRAHVIDKALSALPTHLVVELKGSKSVPHIFSSAKKAEQFVKTLLESGISPSNIGYYERRAMGVTVQI